VGALRRAGVEDNLNIAQDVTIFAPNNEAFNAIGSLVNTMTFDQLTNVLNYHVVQGQLLYGHLLAQGGSVATVQGGNLNMRIIEDQLFVNGARVLAADLLVGNGVVHILDG